MGQCSWIFIFCRFMSTAFFWISPWQLHPPCRLSAEQACPFLLTAQETPPRGAMCADRSLQSDRLLWVQRLPLGEGFWGRRFGTHTEDKNRRGRCPHRPVSRRDGRVRFSDRSGVVPSGAMWASPPTLITHIFCRGRCPHRPVSRRDGRVRFFRPLRGPHPTETRKPPLCQVTVSQLLKNSAQTARAAFFYCWSTSNL